MRTWICSYHFFFKKLVIEVHACISRTMDTDFCEFKASLFYIVSSRPAKAINETLPQNRNNKNKVDNLVISPEVDLMSPHPWIHMLDTHICKYAYYPTHQIMKVEIFFKMWSFILWQAKTYFLLVSLWKHFGELVKLQNFWSFLLITFLYFHYHRNCCSE